MAETETGWGKPTVDGVYWWRLNADDTEPDPVTVRGDFAYDTGYPEPTSTSLGEFLGPISPSDAEQLMELRRVSQTALTWFEWWVESEGADPPVQPVEVLKQLRAVLTPQEEVAN